MIDGPEERDGPERRPLPWGLFFFGALLLLLAVSRVLVDRLHYRAPCPWRELTGFPCPTCFGLRALAAFGRGDWATAFLLHPLITAGSLLLFAWGLLSLGRLLIRPGWRAPRLPPRAKRILLWAIPFLFLANWIFLCLRR